MDAHEDLLADGGGQAVGVEWRSGGIGQGQPGVGGEGGGILAEVGDAGDAGGLGEGELDEACGEGGLGELVGTADEWAHAEGEFDKIGNAVEVWVGGFSGAAAAAAGAEVGLAPAGEGVDTDEEGLGKGSEGRATCGGVVSQRDGYFAYAGGSGKGVR